MRHAVVLAASLALSGCAYHRLTGPVPDPADQSYHRIHSSAFGWGAFEQQTVASLCPTNLLAEVRVRTSLGQSLATVLTLGAWQPATIEYRCSKAPLGEGKIDP